VDVAYSAQPIDVSPSPGGKCGNHIPATDGELLAQFVQHRDQAAFAEVVQRHGRLVWFICRQVLRRHHDVEDAFQATFLILAQRAGTIRASDSAAAWLYRVAQRTALAARRKRAQRREEALIAEPPQGEAALPVIHDRDTMFVLIDELRGLPERYHTPLVLRYFEGLSRRAIAELTDSTLGQIQGRLARGRRMLRSRLVRRGISLSLAAAAVTHGRATAGASVTPALVDETAENCLEFQTSGAAKNASMVAMLLAKEGIQSMGFMSVIKPAALIGAVIFATGVVWAVQQGGGDAADSTIRPSAEVMLEAAAPAPTADQPAVAFVAERTGDADQSNSAAEQLQVKLGKLINDLEAELARSTERKIELAAELEIEELDKYLLKRELDHLHETLIPLKIAASTPEDEAELESLTEKFVEIKDEFTNQLRDTAELSANVEWHERHRQAIQGRLDHLQRVLFEMQISMSAAPPQQGGVVTRYRDFEEFRQAVERQHEQLRHELDALREENAKLKKQLEQRQLPAVTPGPQLPTR
jgi:RNA polymerase sigma factor (sigma-70 family)